jgi:hypothetical protein
VRNDYITISGGKMAEFVQGRPLLLADFAARTRP